MRPVQFLTLLASSVVLSLPLSQAVDFPSAAAIQSLHAGTIVSSKATVHVPLLTHFQDGDSFQATFIVPSDSNNRSFVCDCRDVLQKSVPDPASQIFDFQAFASTSPCGSSDLTLNGIPLNQAWDRTALHAHGEASIPFTDSTLDVWWTSHCLTDSSVDNRGDDSQLLILTIQKVDGRYIRSLSGFTVSFRQTGQPQLLRLAAYPDYSAISPFEVDSWRDPPNYLLPSDPEEEVPASASSASNSTIHELVDELRLLQAESEALVELIQLKHAHIHSLLHQEAVNLREEIHQCDSWLCAVKALWRTVNSTAKLVYLGLRPNPHRDAVRTQNSYWRVTGGQNPTVMKMTLSEDLEQGQPLPQPPPVCHCADGEPGRPIDEKRPFPDELPPRPAPSHRPLLIILIIKTFFLITGLASVFNFIRRRCCSLRRRTDQAARREQRRTERAYRRQARRQAFYDWWHGRRRGTPGRRPGDYEEKRDLILRQEGVLEGVMQDEIRQLQVQEEIRQLRQTHTTVDQLVRAEEGRSRHHLQQDLHLTVASSSSHPHGFVSIPIPARSTGDSSYTAPPPPRSRSSSLPDYSSESGMSNPPPSYKSRVSVGTRSEVTDEDTDADADADVTSDYTPSTSSQWTPGSSIPDISPRPSIETTRTFL